MAKIICGVNELENQNFNNKTIHSVMDDHRDILNIPDNCVILVNDEDTSDTDYVIQSTDVVEFVKASGDKGIY